jgi:dihydrofolate reductase/thymidylate synthase
MVLNIIVAFTSKKFGIGNNGKLPWNIPEDIKRFRNLTTDSVVIMGYKTWESIEKKPLKDRKNIIITSKIITNSLDDTLFMNMSELDDLDFTIYNNVFIIGGVELYKKYIGLADNIYATIIEKEYDCDVFFPIDNFNKYEIDEYSEQKEYDNIKYRFVNYKKTDIRHEEYNYLNLMKNILTTNDRPDRTGVGTKSIFAPDPLRFDISKSLPVITTKFVPFLLTVKELIWFLQGKTDSKILENQNVNIWKGNTTREFLDNRGLTNYEIGDIGPMYGYNWRFYGDEYKGCNYNNYKGFDQLTDLIKNLREDPFSRRHVITTFNPSTVSQSVLMPCHGIVVQFNVDERNNKKYLSCHMYQRSQDTFLGSPINIMSYSILTYIIAKMTDMFPDKLIISIGDSHIYKNHIEQCKLQLSRNPFPFPKLELNINTIDDIHDIQLSNFKLIGYLHHETIKGDMAI